MTQPIFAPQEHQARQYQPQPQAQPQQVSIIIHLIFNVMLMYGNMRKTLEMKVKPDAVLCHLSSGATTKLSDN